MTFKVSGHRPAYRICISIFLTGLMLAGSAGAADITNVVGGNSASNELLGLDFDAQIATVLNDDKNTRVSLKSFDFFDDLCKGRLDVVAADTNPGEVILYENGFGTSSTVCSGAGCPSRPDGISLSDKRVMAVADTGQGGDSTPSVWFFPPEHSAEATSCDDGDGFGPFSAPASTGQLRVCDGSSCDPVTGVLDTEFVSVPGGGLRPGDLVFISANPTTIARLTSDQVDQLLAGGSASSTDAQILANLSELGGVDPAALAFIPNTAAVGNATVSESEDLLVAGVNGLIGKLRFLSVGGIPTISELVPNYLGVDLGNGPLGIAAGIVDRETFIVVAVRNGGSFLKVPLEDIGVGAPDLEPVSPPWSEITSGIQNPQGVAINTKAVAAENCDTNNQDPNNIGCNVRNTLDLLYTQNIVLCTGTNDPPDCVPNDTILANIQVVEDPRNSARDISFSDLGLDGGYVVPAACQGLELADDGISVLVVADITKQFPIEPGDYVQVIERVEQILPQLAACDVVGTRVFYRPVLSFGQPEGNALHDITVDCDNPSRSIGRDNSPLVFCADAFFDPNRNGAPKGRAAKGIASETAQRLDYLEDTINALSDSAITGLKADLLDFVDAARGFIKKKKFVEISAQMDAGAEYVYSNKIAFEAVAPLPAGPDATAYGDLLGRFLSLAFFSFETATGGDYCAPDVGLSGIPCQAP
jgi:hypothetical protein